MRLALPILLALLATTAAQAAGPRAVSINLCTDQLLVTLADPDQILGLSPFARDPISSIREASADYPVLSGTAEEVLIRRPDFVLAGRFTKRATREMLRRQGVRVEEFEAAGSIADALAQIRRMGALLGQAARAERKAGEIEAALARARAATLSRPVSVLALQRRGWVSGRNTLISSLLESVGLRNAGAAYGSGRFARLEEVVTLDADLLLVSGSGRRDDQGSALLEHPALAARYPPDRRLVLSDLMTSCGGPALVDALDRLTAEIGRRRP